MVRTGLGYPGATYFKTINVQGPQLFTEVNDNSVFYHHHGKWHQYITACDIKFGTINSSNSNPDRATNDDTVIHPGTDESDWVFISQDEKDQIHN